MNEFYHKFYSQYLQRDFEMLVFGHSGQPVILFPKTRGRYYEMKDSGVINELSGHIESGKIKVYCPDTIDNESWYNYNIDPSDRVKKHLAYEKTILKDVIDFAKYELDSRRVGVAGFEFGAYHSANLAFKYPNLISNLFCFGGTYDIKRHIMGFYNHDCYFNNPPDYLPGLQDEWYINYLKEMDIRIIIGKEDQYYLENLQISEILSEKKVSHLFDITDNTKADIDYYKRKLCLLFE